MRDKMEIKIIETSDMHGYVLPTNYAERNLDLGFSTAKAATIIKKIKKEAKGPVVQIENGDFIQGSPLSYYVRKQGHHIAHDLTKVLNYLEYDLGILGNHEFNYGLDYLREAIESYNHPIICANILSKTGEQVFGEPYRIIEKEGEPYLPTTTYLKFYSKNKVGVFILSKQESLNLQRSFFNPQKAEMGYYYVKGNDNKIEIKFIKK